MRVTDKGLVRFVRKMQDLPGQHLFQYVDENGKPAPIGSSEVNAYIKETMGAEFTAKDFRTWAASVIAFQTMHVAKKDLSKRELLEVVADRLGNTPAIARKSYIHPAVLAAMDSQQRIRAQRLPRATRWLSRYDRGLMDFLAEQPATRELLCA